MASDTPRTDAAIAACLAESKYEPPIGPLAELARQLERDLSRVIGQFNAAVLELAQRPEAREPVAWISKSGLEMLKDPRGNPLAYVAHTNSDAYPIPLYLRSDMNNSPTKEKP